MPHLGREGILVLMIDSDRSPQQLNAVEVVHRQDCAPLVFVLDEAEALRRAEQAVVLMCITRTRHWYGY